MSEKCTDLGPLRDAFADGQIGEADAERVRRHLEECQACRRDVRERAVLRRALGRVVLPSPPPYLRTRIEASLDRADRRWVGTRFVRWSSVAVAGLAAAILLLLITPAGADVPPVIRDSSDFHDRVVSGAVQPTSLGSAAALQDYFRKETGADVSIPKSGCGCCSSGGACLCPMSGGKLSAPCIVYRHGSTPISLLVVPGEGAPLPAHARRSRAGFEYYVFHRGRNTVILCRSHKDCHVWVARMSEEELLEAAAGSRT